MIIKPCANLFSDVYLTLIYSWVTLPRSCESCFSEIPTLSALCLHICMCLIGAPGELLQCEGHRGCLEVSPKWMGLVQAGWTSWCFVIANLLMCDWQVWDDVIVAQK